MKRTGDIIAWLDYKGTGTSVGRMFGSGPLLERLDRLGRPACRPTLLPNSNRLIVFCLLVSLLAVVSEAQLCGRDAGGALCRDSLCCSTFGFCGTGSQYCGNGCQSNCNSSATDTSVICGFAANNTLCPEQYCCSQWGYCGTSEEFCGDKCQSGPCIKSSSSSGLKLWAKIVIVVAAAIATVAICAIVGAIVCCFRRNRLAKQIRTVSEASHSMRDSSVDIVGPSADRSIGTIPTGMTYIFSDNQKVLGMKFSYDYLSAATNGFSKELGRGAFGVVYKGLLRDNTEVAVKSLLDNHRGLKDFEAEIKTLGNINHANLVALRGFCYEPNKPAYIVYEFAQNGSLDKWIFRTDKNPLALTWKLRMDIARGTARGLSYLHEDLQIGQAIIHLDIKPENILLDENFVPKVADFGMAKLIGEKRTLTIASGGTLGYMAPETYAGVATTKMDVYSFGMVLLELVCGRRNLNVNLLPEDEFYLPVWALRKVLVNEESEIVDPNLNGLFDPTEARTLIMAALLCLQRDPELRCDMSDVWKMIEGLITPPDLPDSLKADLDMVERILRRSSTSNSATTSTAGSIDRGSQGISSSMGTILSMSSNGSAPARSTSSSDSRSFDHETLSHRSMQLTMRPLLGTRVTLSQNSLPASMRSPRQQSPTHRSSIM